MSDITGTGFMKWNPMNFSGRSVRLASRVIEMEEFRRAFKVLNIDFSAATVSSMAVSATNGARKELTTHKMVLNIAVLLWMMQAMISAGNVALLFVRPAAVAVVRSSPGSTAVFKYAIWIGLVAASLPTYTKVSLRALEEECSNSDTKAE